MRRIKEGNSGCGRAGEKKGLKNEHREDALSIIDDVTHETSFEKLMPTLVKIPADKPTLSTISSISLDDSN
jgi:hypothetical protein